MNIEKIRSALEFARTRTPAGGPVSSQAESGLMALAAVEREMAEARALVEKAAKMTDSFAAVWNRRPPFDVTKPWTVTCEVGEDGSWRDITTLHAELRAFLGPASDKSDKSDERPFSQIRENGRLAVSLVAEHLANALDWAASYLPDDDSKRHVSAVLDEAANLGIYADQCSGAFLEPTGEVAYTYGDKPAECGCAARVAIEEIDVTLCSCRHDDKQGCNCDVHAAHAIARAALAAPCGCAGLREINERLEAVAPKIEQMRDERDQLRADRDQWKALKDRVEEEKARLENELATANKRAERARAESTEKAEKIRELVAGIDGAECWAPLDAVAHIAQSLKSLRTAFAAALEREREAVNSLKSALITQNFYKAAQVIVAAFDARKADKLQAEVLRDNAKFGDC